MHLEAHLHGEDLTSLFPIVIDESELSVYTEDDLVEERDAADEVVAELAECSDPVDAAGSSFDLERTAHRDELAELHAREAGLGRAPYTREAKLGRSAHARETKLGSLALAHRAEVGDEHDELDDPDKLHELHAREADVPLDEELHAREAEIRLDEELQAREADADDEVELDEDDSDDVEPLAPRRPVTLAERARDLASRFAMRVLVPVIAIAMLVVAMGGTWTTAGATPVHPWSATVPPGGRANTASTASGKAGASPNPAREGSGGSASGATSSGATSSGATPSDATSPGAVDTPIYRAKSGHGTLSGKLNLNTASEDQLMLLPTVGPAKAERIVTWRKKNGGFKRTADLRRVKGFGYKTFKKLEPFLDTKGDTTLVPK